VETSQRPACDHDADASLYALGLLEAEELDEFERHLASCARCEAEMRRSGNLAVSMIEALPPVAPPEGLLDRVRPVLPAGVAALPAGVAALCRGSEVRWQPTPFEGVFIHRLYDDRARNQAADLIRMSPGAVYPSHHHIGLEHCYVVQGDLDFGDHVLFSGDYEAARPTTGHSPVTTRNGCLLFLVHDVRDEVRV
jgi:hypothetical protein